MLFRLGLIVNPYAGLGGSVALKGSDGVAQQALALGATPKAHLRMTEALKVLLPYKDRIEIYTVSGEMGENIVRELDFNIKMVYEAPHRPGSKDTRESVKVLNQTTIDLLLFAGGDGTARDVFQVVREDLPVLGVPAGVKIHSGVYGITPKASGLVVKMLLEGELVSLTHADVMDIDESAFRDGIVKARRFGEMLVPAEPRYVQAVKTGGKEDDELVLADIAADVIESMDDELYIMGSGSTVAAVMESLDLDNTLLGVDLVLDEQLIESDLTAQDLLALTKGRTTKLVITLIGGQGHIFGRGNQQLSPELIRRVGKENIIILATKTKLKALAGRPLIADSGDPVLDSELSGYYQITTGYHDSVMYQVATPEESEM